MEINDDGRPARSAQGTRVCRVNYPCRLGESLKNGNPIAMPLYLDGSDTNMASELKGRVEQSLGDFQKWSATR